MREERDGVKKEGAKVVEQRKGQVRTIRGRKEEEPTVGNSKQKLTVSQNIQFIPKFNSKQEYRSWASSGMVASVIEGDSALSLQHRVEDVDFHKLLLHPWVGITCFFTAMTAETYGKFLMMRYIFLECCLQIFINGRHRMSGMSVGRG